MKKLSFILSLAILLPSALRADDFGKFKSGVFQKSASDDSGSVPSSDIDGAKGAAAAQKAKVDAAIAAGKPLVGSPGKDADARVSALASGCDQTPFSPSRNPDSGDAWTCAGDMYDIMTSGGGSTDRTSNSGMIRYIRQSVMADCALYHSAFAVYKKLKDSDMGGASPGDPAGASIEAKASKNALQLARDEVKNLLGHDDPYLAIKTLAVYGHDNRFNFLTNGAGNNANACQLKVLDVIKPNANSNLYMNGAAGREYWDDDVAGAVQVQRDCMSAAGSKPVEADMCGGEYTSYQADYYHVIMSAFLNCHCLARGSSVLDSMAGGLTKDGYLWAAAKYKNDRFDEEIKAGLGKQGHTPAVDLVSKAWSEKGGTDMTQHWKLTCDSVKASDCLRRAQVDSWDWQGWCSQVNGCGDKDIALAKALLKRYVFEMNFRVDQHFMGYMIAHFDLQCDKASLKHPMCPK